MGIRVLVIEDEAEIADFVVRGLREEGFTVGQAADGAAGWHELQSAHWDVVLLDWWLPGEDGLSLLRRFRQRDRATPVLFLTARDAVSDRVRGPRRRGRRLPVQAVRLRGVAGAGARPGPAARRGRHRPRQPRRAPRPGDAARRARRPAARPDRQGAGPA